MPNTKKVLILGGGFAGVAAAKALAHNPKVQVTLVNRSNYQVFHACLFEIAAEEMTRETALILLRQIFQDGVELRRDNVVKIDKKKRKVYTADKASLEYDFLVLALGLEGADFGIPGVAEHAFTFREIDEVLLLRDNLRTTFHLAKERGQKEINIVICGGGFTGVELAGELRWHLEKLRREYRTGPVNITLVEAGSRILPGMSDEVVRLALGKLKKLGVSLILEEPVVRVGKDEVRLKSGKFLPTDVTIWTTGTKPSTLPADAGLPLDERGRPVVNEHLAVLGYPEIFVAGDLAGYTNPKTGKGVPPQAYNAIAMGEVVGENILRTVRRMPLKKFKAPGQNFIIPVGHNDAVGFLFGKVVSGRLVSILRRIIEFRYLASLFGPIGAWPVFWAEVKVIAD